MQSLSYWVRQFSVGIRNLKLIIRISYDGEPVSTQGKYVLCVHMKTLLG